MLGLSDNSRTRLLSPAAAVVWGFASLVMFPAIPAGNTFGIDASMILTGVLLLVRPSIIIGRSMPFMVLMTLPLVQGTLAAMVPANAIASGIMVKSALSFFLGVMPFIAGYELVRAGRLAQVMTGVCLALPIHALVAVDQMITFDQGTLPFLGLMATNPALAFPPEVAPFHAEFIRRPFGLFAEPSAMAACVGPWLVLIAGLSVVEKERFPGLGVPRGILALGLASGCFLMGVSQSGDAAVVVVGMAVALWAGFAAREGAAVSRRRLWATIVVVLGVIAATSQALVADFSRVGLDSRVEGSWTMRANSFAFLPNALGHDVWTFLFGVGPGQSYPMIQAGTRFASGLPPEVKAVWSIAGGYVAETGFFGFMCIAIIGLAAAVSIWESTQKIFGIACAVVWLVGVVFATSHVPQPAIWFFLAVLLHWRKLFGLAETTVFPRRSAGVLVTR